MQKIDNIRVAILRDQEATAAAEQQNLHAQAIRGAKPAAISTAEVDLAAAQAELAAFTEVHADLPVQIRSDPVWQQRFAAFWGEVNAAAKQAEEAAAARSRGGPPPEAPAGKRPKPNPATDGAGVAIPPGGDEEMPA